MCTKQVLTVVGPIESARPYYVCPGCQKGQSPKDIELDIEGTGFSGCCLTPSANAIEDHLDRTRDGLAAKEPPLVGVPTPGTKTGRSNW